MIAFYFKYKQIWNINFNSETIWNIIQLIISIGNIISRFRDLKYNQITFELTRSENLMPRVLLLAKTDSTSNDFRLTFFLNLTLQRHFATVWLWVVQLELCNGLFCSLFFLEKIIYLKIIVEKTFFIIYCFWYQII